MRAEQRRPARWIAWITSSFPVRQRASTRYAPRCERPRLWNGAGGEIRRHRKAAGKAHKARQAWGRPQPWTAEGGGARKREVLTVFRRRRNAVRWSRKGALRRKSRRHRFKPGQGLGRVVATRRKIRTVVGSRRRFAGNREAERVTRDRKVSRRRLIVPNGREADIAQGGGAPKLRLSFFCANQRRPPPL